MFKSIPLEHKAYFLLRKLIQSEQSGFLKKDKIIHAFAKHLEASIKSNESATDSINSFFSENKEGIFNSRSSKVTEGYNRVQQYLLKHVLTQNDVSLLYGLTRWIIPISNQKVNDTPGKEFLKIARKLAINELND